MLIYDTLLPGIIVLLVRLFYTQDREFWFLNQDYPKPQVSRNICIRM